MGIALTRLLLVFITVALLAVFVIVTGVQTTPAPPGYDVDQLILLCSLELCLSSPSDIELHHVNGSVATMTGWIINSGTFEGNIDITFEKSSDTFSNYASSGWSRSGSSVLITITDEQVRDGLDLFLSKGQTIFVRLGFERTKDVRLGTEDSMTIHVKYDEKHITDSLGINAPKATIQDVYDELIKLEEKIDSQSD